MLNATRAHITSLILVTALATPAIALEPIIGFPIYKADYKRNPYNTELILAALDETVSDYGPYSFSYPSHPMGNDRTIVELVKGHELHLTQAPYRKHWLGKSIIVPFPINKGINSYRVFFSHERHKKAFSKVSKLDHLRAFSFGQGRGWSTVNVLKKYNFDIIYIDSYDGLFDMIEKDRFQLLMQGVQEVFVEKGRTMLMNEGAYLVDEFYAFVYLPSYIHVTPTQPELAKRLELGLTRLNKKGEVDALLHKHSSKAIQIINSIKGPVFFLENINLPPGSFERDKPLLLDAIKNSVHKPG
ncbi:hypothetical protein SAMN02745866_01458 [Alteromonadaceae bacterium Bs31]|nr:hypothetical protein SAMN02745866_01458 [Alteromonadaceae bacterium Bs31]